MKILIEKPPIWKEANELFKLEELNLGTIFTYGDVLYNPFNVNITLDLIAHEEKHAEQQEHNDVVAGLWWKRYLSDPLFRIEQETEAYAAQYRCICKAAKDRNKRARELNELGRILSGKMYGNAVTQNEAIINIRKLSRVV